jgi:hypothetical protein
VTTATDTGLGLAIAANGAALAKMRGRQRGAALAKSFGGSAAQRAEVQAAEVVRVLEHVRRNLIAKAIEVQDGSALAKVERRELAPYLRTDRGAGAIGNAVALDQIRKLRG